MTDPYLHDKIRKHEDRFSELESNIEKRFEKIEEQQKKQNEFGQQFRDFMLKLNNGNEIKMVTELSSGSFEGLSDLIIEKFLKPESAEIYKKQLKMMNKYIENEKKNLELVLEEHEKFTIELSIRSTLDGINAFAQINNLNTLPVTEKAMEKSIKILLSEMKK